jgi:DNA-binding MarR family transcriptional regulator
MNMEKGAMAKAPSNHVVSAWARLLRARDASLSRIEAELKAAELPPLAWYDVLLELRQAEGGKLRPFELEGRLLLEQHNVSRLIDRMEAKGLVRRIKLADDGRGQAVAITEEGRALQKKMWLVYGPAIEGHVGRKLAASEAATLAGLLQKLL